MKVEWKSCLRVGVSVFLLYLCIRYWDAAASVLLLTVKALAPFVMGCITAYVLNIPMSFYERHYFLSSPSRAVTRSRRIVCMIAAFLTMILCAVLISTMIIPELTSSIKLLLERFPSLADSLLENESAAEWLPEEWLIGISNIDWEAGISDLLDYLGSGMAEHADTIASVISGVLTNVVNWFIGLVFAIYLLCGKEKLLSQANRLMETYIRADINQKIHYVFSVFNDSFHRFIVGQCTEAVILGILCTLGMLILRIPYAAAIGSLVGFTALIPIIGAYIGAIVGMLLIMSESPVKALVFLIFIIILQQMEGDFIYPRVVGSSIGLPSIWVFAAVTVGGAIGGISGMLLGVPLASALYRLLRENLYKKRQLNASSQ